MRLLHPLNAVTETFVLLLSNRLTGSLMTIGIQILLDQLDPVSHVMYHDPELSMMVVAVDLVRQLHVAV
jgi:hypothetical protein